MSGPSKPQEWLSLDDALELFRVTRAELLAAAEDGTVQALFAQEDGALSPRFLLRDLRARFEEIGEPQKAAKRSVLGYGVAAGAGAVGAKIIEKLADGTADAALKVLAQAADQLFREAPPVSTRPMPPLAGASEVRPPVSTQPRPNPSAAPSSPSPAGRSDMAMRPGRDYRTNTMDGGFGNRRG